MIDALAHSWSLPLWLVGAVVVTLAFSARYALMSGGALLLVTVFAASLRTRRIQSAPFTRAQLLRELSWSAVSILVIAVIAGAGIAYREQGGPAGLYLDPGEYGWAWLIMSVPVVLLLHDAYFYWTHRLLHHPKLIKWCHAVHHRSHNPSPLSALAFHPIEAVVNGFGVVLIVAIFAIVGFSFNVMGHLGYELYPRWLLRSWIGKWLNSATSHNLHHRAYKYQFGLYTLIWDRMCGTLHPNYDAMRAGHSGAAYPATNLEIVK
jgi:Delta7-sterol 5-desaturase